MNETPQKIQISAEVLPSVILHAKYKEQSLLIQDQIYLSNFEVNGDFRYTYQMNTWRKAIVFKDCLFNNEFHFSNYSNIGWLIFYNCIFKNKASLTGIRCSIKVQNSCHFRNDVYLSSESTHDLLIEDTTLDSKLIFNGNFHGNTTLRNINTKRNKKGEIELKTVVIQKLEINNIYCSNFTITDQSILEGEANLLKLHTSNLTIMHITIGLILRIKNSEILQFIIDNLDKKANRKIEVNYTNIIKASLPLHMLSQTFIHDECVIGELRLWEKNSKGSYLSVENSTIEKLEFDKIHNEGGITFRKINMPSNGEIVMTSSNLGETDFILCNFSKTIFKFENSKIANLFLSETDFPEKVNPDHAQAQLAFGQLHTAFQKQGDTVRALEYQSREIEAHYRKLKWFITTKKPYVSFTWLNLWLNKISNDFGRNWFKGIIFSFFMGIIFFSLLVLSVNAPNTNLLESYIKFMNPIRFFELEKLFDPPATLSTSSYFFDFLGRIFVAYGFYQTIQAFRRYGRK